MTQRRRIGIIRFQSYDRGLQLAQRFLRNVHRVNIPNFTVSFRGLPQVSFVRPPRIWAQICRCSAAVRPNMGKAERSTVTALCHEWLKAFTPHLLQGWWLGVLRRLSSTCTLCCTFAQSPPCKAISIGLVLHTKCRLNALGCTIFTRS